MGCCSRAVAIPAKPLQPSLTSTCSVCMWGGTELGVSKRGAVHEVRPSPIMPHKPHQVDFYWLFRVSTGKIGQSNDWALGRVSVTCEALCQQLDLHPCGFGMGVGGCGPGALGPQRTCMHGRRASTEAQRACCVCVCVRAQGIGCGFAWCMVAWDSRGACWGGPSSPSPTPTHMCKHVYTHTHTHTLRTSDSCQIASFGIEARAHAHTRIHTLLTSDSCRIVSLMNKPVSF